MIFKKKWHNSWRKNYKFIVMKHFLSIVIALVMVFTLKNCGAQKIDASTYQRQWMLVEFQKFDKNVLLKHNAHLDLSPTKSPKNEYRAFMGCNKIFLNADFQSHGKVVFSKIGSSLMACNNMDLEYAFAKALPTMTQYKIEGHRMTLSDGKGNEMKFIASDWD